MCENCVELLFVRGSGACPQCNVPLRRTNFRVQMFEDAFVEKDTDIRKRVLRDYNKKEEDFASLREYNDYLEEVESIIFNLCNNIDVEETKQKIEDYKQENKDNIRRNRAKLSNEEMLLQDMIEEEKQMRERTREELLQEERNQKKEKIKNKEALIDELMMTDLPADHILAKHKHEQGIQQDLKQTQRFSHFSSGIQVGKGHAFVPIPRTEEAECYAYEPLVMDNLGPQAPDVDQLQEYLRHMRRVSDSERAGGYVESIGCQRAVQDAFCGLFFSLHQDLMSTVDRNSPYMDTL